MSGTTLTIDATIEDRRLRALLKRLAKHAIDATPAMSAIGETVLTSIRRNFEAGGRPEKWTPSRRVELNGGQTLVDTAVLKNSLNVSAGKDFAAVGTADKRAGVHHFGAEKGSFGTVAAQVKAHLRMLKSGKAVQVGAHTRKQPMPWGDIPARPFMLVQDEDVEEIRAMLADFMAGL